MIESLFSTLWLPLSTLCMIIALVYVIFPKIRLSHYLSLFSSSRRVFIYPRNRYAAATLFLMGILPYIFPSLQSELSHYPELAIASIFAATWFFTVWRKIK